MYRRHATPYMGLAGLVELCRARAVVGAANVKPDDRLLEVGCEAGRLLLRFPACARVAGFDISKDALEDARRSFEAIGREAVFVQGDASQPLPFARGEFTVIVCSEMLEHVPDPRLCLENITAIAGPGCRIILTVPNEGPKLRIKRFLNRFGLMRVMMPGIEGDQSEWHLQSFDATRLRAVCDGLLTIRRWRRILGLHYLVEGRATGSSR